MKLRRAGDSVFELTVAAPELSALMAATRLAAEVLEHDEQAPPEAVERVRALLDDYDRAIGGGQSQTDERRRRSS